jgi:CheY-like chemotaxis protein
MRASLAPAGRSHLPWKSMSAPYLLVVDDESTNVHFLQRKLEREGIRVAAMENTKRYPEG